MMLVAMVVVLVEGLICNLEYRVANIFAGQSRARNPEQTCPQRLFIDFLLSMTMMMTMTDWCEQGNSQNGP